MASVATAVSSASWPTSHATSPAGTPRCSATAPTGSENSASQRGNEYVAHTTHAITRPCTARPICTAETSTLPGSGLASAALRVAHGRRIGTPVSALSLTMDDSASSSVDARESEKPTTTWPTSPPTTWAPGDAANVAAMRPPTMTKKAAHCTAARCAPSTAAARKPVISGWLANTTEKSAGPAAPMAALMETKPTKCTTPATISSAHGVGRTTTAAAAEAAAPPVPVCARAAAALRSLFQVPITKRPR
mmetsp:Transcript_7730/g.27478  ORF Transcript_7730/g.27478 Transcript_7730/m.27478 type:complete len:249 (+) Transcript_7730:321-1067(+)